MLKLTTAKLDLRRFERRGGEVLLSAEVLGHRLIDVQNARLVRAWDLQLYQDGTEWVLSGVDTRHRPRRLFGLLGPGPGHDAAAGVGGGTAVAGTSGTAADGPVFRDWHDFESLIGHAGSELRRGPFARVRRFKPAQIADLLEDASKKEESEILGRVHADPELEADVFEELDEDRDYGYSLLWTLLLLIPVLIVNQEMVVRLGAVTGVGHARLINERFGRFWWWFREPHPRNSMSEADRLSWRMPPLALLKPVEWSSGTKLGMAMLRGYLVISVLLLVVKAVQIGGG